MKRALMILALGLLCAAGCSRKEEPQTTATTNSIGDNPLTAPADYLGAVSKAQKSAVKTIDTVSLNQSVQLFQVSEGRYPNNLQELVTEGYLPSLPKPPTGMRFQYDPQTGKVQVVAQ